MTTGRIIFIHGRGHNAPRTQVWRRGLQVGLTRAGYDFAATDIRSISLPVKYAAFLNPGVSIPPAKPLVETPAPSEAACIGLESRNDVIRDRIGAGLPVGYKSKVFGQVSRQRAITDQVLKQRFADVALYMEDEDRRRHILLEIRHQLPTRGRAVVIAHSLGSVIALDLLRYWPPELHIDLLLTVGSPAALRTMAAHLGDCRDYLPADRIGSWVNAFDSDDPITGGAGLVPTFGGLVVDHHVENGGIRSNHDVDRYLEHITPSLVLGPILEEYLGRPEAPPTKIPEDELESAAWLDRALSCEVREELLRRAPDQSSRASRLLACEHSRVSANRAFRLPAETNLADHLQQLAVGLPPEVRLKVLVQLRASEAFAPFDIPVEDDEYFGSLVALTQSLGWPAQVMQDVHHAVARASAAQDASNRRGAALVGGVAVVAAAIATGGVGLVAAPGLAGAAAIASGLSGLGSLVGGTMAAGLFVTAGAGAAAPGLAFAALRMLDAGQTLDEVTKIHAEALVHRWEDRQDNHDRIVRDLEGLLDEAERSIRLHRSVEAGMRASDYAKAWRTKADILGRALSDLGVRRA